MERSVKLSFPTHSANGTSRFGVALGKNIDNGYCISLVGGLGAGKTVLAGSICKGLGIDEEVLSPTFVLFEEFNGRLPVVHVDLYRIEHEAELEELGVFDNIGRGKVILAEWGDRSDSLLNESDIVITLVIPQGGKAADTERMLDISCTEPAAAIFRGGDRW